MSPSRVAAILRRPVVQVAELHELGLGRTTIARRCRPGGPWQSLAPGLVLIHNGPVGRDDRRLAAIMRGGPGTVITGLDALALHGMTRAPAPSGPVHILIPHDRRRTGRGIALVERTTRLPEPVQGRWPLAPLPRAVLDFCRRCRARDTVRSAIAEVVQRGRCTPAELAAELRAGDGSGSALPREVLREVGDGVRSVAEAKARELILQSDLPRPMWNVDLVDHAGRFVARPDAWFDEAGVAWEIDSVEWHLDPDDYAATLARSSAMTALGVPVIHTLPRTLHSAPRLVLDELGRTIDHAARSPRPAVRAVPART